MSSTRDLVSAEIQLVGGCVVVMWVAVWVCVWVCTWVSVDFVSRTV